MCLCLACLFFACSFSCLLFLSYVQVLRNQCFPGRLLWVAVLCVAVTFGTVCFCCLRFLVAAGGLELGRLLLARVQVRAPGMRP